MRSVQRNCVQRLRWMHALGGAHRERFVAASAPTVAAVLRVFHSESRSHSTTKAIVRGTPNR